MVIQNDIKSAIGRKAIGGKDWFLELAYRQKEGEDPEKSNGGWKIHLRIVESPGGHGGNQCGERAPIFLTMDLLLERNPRITYLKAT